MTFENPSVLWLLSLLLVFVVGLALWGWVAKREVAQVLLVNMRRLRWNQVIKYLVAACLMALLVLALGLPKVPSSSLGAATRTGEIALLVDTSASMAAQRDLRSPSNLDRTKPILATIVDRMEELGAVRISLHGFTSIARSHVPWVGPEDYAYLRASIEKVLDVNSTPGQGSSLGQPILGVIDKFSAGEEVKLIVLLSDGEHFVGVSRGMHGSEQGLIERAISRARSRGVRVVTVGVGEQAGAKIPQYDESGEFTGEYAQLHNADLEFYLVEDALRDVAQRTGGRYFAEDERGDLIDYLDANLRLATAEEAAKETSRHRSVARWFLLAAAPLWVVLARRYLL